MSHRRQGREPVAAPVRMGRYDVLAPIARGGMATVYLARIRGPRGFERNVALKLMHPHLRDSPQFGSDLIHEAMLTVSIRHPNVVAVLDADEDDSGVYLVMEYVEGESLAGLRRAADSAGVDLPTSIGLRILLDALAGLHAAHDITDEAGRPLGLVHRDFSPHNLLVGTDGITRLADFGVAKATSRVGHTQTGLIKGKLGYMAPEQARAAAIDRRCDIWAAGVVAWELVAGQRLYPSNDASTLLDIVSTVPPRVRSVRPDVPVDLDEAIAKALSMDPRDRFPTAHALSESIARSGVEIADHREVALQVARLVGPALAERRERVGGRAESKESGAYRRDLAFDDPRIAAEPTRTDTNSVSSADLARAPARSRRLVFVSSLVVVGIMAAGGALANRWRRTHTPPAETADRERDRADVPVATGATAEPTSAPETTAPSALAPVAAIAPSARALTLDANAPLASVAVDGRNVKLQRPATHATVDLTPEESGRAVEIVAIDTRGRSVKQSVGPAEASAELHFATTAPPPARKSSERPLAASPYRTP